MNSKYIIFLWWKFFLGIQRPTGYFKLIASINIGWQVTFGKYSLVNIEFRWSAIISGADNKSSKHSEMLTVIVYNQRKDQLNVLKLK